MPIPYPLATRSEISFEFITDGDVKYYVYFLDYSAMFTSTPKLESRIYMFNIEAASGFPEKQITDERIALTIQSVFELFFMNTQNVAVYVCDGIDSRQLARKRKFDMWFRKYNDGSLLKENDIVLIEGVEVYNSIIVHRNNDEFNALVAIYRALNRGVGLK